MQQRLFKFLRKSLAVWDSNLVFIFTKVEVVLTKKYFGFSLFGRCIGQLILRAIFSAQNRGSWDFRGFLAKFFDQKVLIFCALTRANLTWLGGQRVGK